MIQIGRSRTSALFSFGWGISPWKPASQSGSAPWYRVHFRKPDGYNCLQWFTPASTGMSVACHTGLIRCIHSDSCLS